MATTTTNPVTTPALTTYSRNQVAGLQPIISDLLTENQSGSKFRANTYTGDTAKIQERLNQYNVYSPQELGGLTDYFKTQAVVAPSTGNKFLKSPVSSGSLFIKPSDFASLQSGLSSIKKSDIGALSNMLGGVGTVGDLGEYTYYKKPELEKALNNFGTLDASGSFMDGITPVSTLGDKNYYSVGDIDTVLGRVGSLSSISPEILSKYSGQLEGVQSVGTLNGQSLYNREQVDPVLSAEALSALRKSLGLSYTPSGDTALPEPLTGINGLTKHTQSNRDRYKDYVASSLMLGNEIPLDAFELGNYQYNEIIPRNPVYGQIADQFNSVYGTDTNKDLMNKVGSSLGLSPKEINDVAGSVAADRYLDAYAIGMPAWQLGADTKTKLWTDALIKYAEDKYGRTLPAEYKSELNKAASSVDKQFADARAIESHSGGVFSDALPIVSTVLKFTPLAPVAYGYDIYNAINNNNPLGVVGAALGAYGAINPGANLAGSLGNYVNSGLNLGLTSQGALNALGSGLISGGGGLLSGKSPLEAVKMGLGSGLGSYVGGLVNSSVGGGIAGSALGGLSSGILNSGVTGNSIGSGALVGGLGGLGNYFGGALGSSLAGSGVSPLVSGNIGRAGSTLLNSYLQQKIAPTLRRV